MPIVLLIPGALAAFAARAGFLHVVRAQARRDFLGFLAEGQGGAHRG